MIIWTAFKTLGSLFVLACCLRFYIQLLRLNPQNPLSRTVIRMTDWIVLPMRRLVSHVSGLGRFDWASLLAAILISLVMVVIFYALVTASLLAGYSPPDHPVRPFGWLVALACLWLVQWSLQLAVIMLTASVLLSWFSPLHPLKPVFDLLAAPMLAPFRRLLSGKRPGSVDFSPIGAFLMLQIASGLLATADAAVMRHLF